MADQNEFPKSRTWVPTLYVAEGLPYALAMSVAAVLYKNLGVLNAQITFWISLLGACRGFKVVLEPWWTF